MKRFSYLTFLVTGASAYQVHTMAEGTRHKYANGFGVPWGPQNCAELLRSSAGTCVIRTKCTGVDLSKFEFAFDCESSGATQRHSFGIGGFDDEDDFDTNVKCATCLPPDADYEGDQARTSHHTHHEVAVQNLSPDAVHNSHIHKEVAVSKVSSTHMAKVPHTHHEVVVVGVRLSSAGQAEVKEEAETKQAKQDKNQKEEKEKEEEKKEEETKEEPTPPAKVTRFGPGDCISTWRNDTTGTCIMQTSCNGQNTADHMFGLICKQGEGNSSLVRHLFGRDTFAASETFDTLIPCDECLSMGYVKEETYGEKTLVDMVKDLAGVVSQVKDGMKDLKSDVATLKNQVLDKDDTNSTAKTDEGDSTAKKEDTNSTETKEDAAETETKEDAAEAETKEDATEAPEKNESALVVTGVTAHATVQKPVQLRGGDSRSSRQKRDQDDADDADKDDEDSS